MYNSRQSKLQLIRDEITNGLPIANIPADSLTLGDAFQLIHLERSIWNAKMRAAREIDRMMNFGNSDND
jgi:hypothetical protein